MSETIEEWDSEPSELEQERRPFLKFDGNYGRDGMFWIEHGSCMRCEQVKTVLCVDASEDEYTTGRICLDCVKEVL